MNERREYAGGVLLKDGRVLAVSGHPLGGVSIGTAEVYDPKTDQWTASGSLHEPRNSGNAATVLPDGRVILPGGHDGGKAISGAEVFDPSSGSWSATGALSVARDPVTIELADGRVLASGGVNWYTKSGKAFALTETYDASDGEWTVTGPLNTPRYAHRSVVLNDGRVLAVGGYTKHDALLASAELYDPTTGHWRLTDGMPSARAWFGLVKLRDGRVMAAGGYTGTSSNRTYLDSVMIFDSETEHWEESRPMTAKRAGFSITLLASGQVLVAGGVAESGKELASAELFDPSTGIWLPAPAMNVPRRNHRATLLRSGDVLVIGGSNVRGNNYLDSCEVFSPR